jgi:hypothetical protein
MAPNDPDMDAVLNSASSVYSPPVGETDPDMEAVLARAPSAPQTTASRAAAPSRTFGERAIGAGEAALSTLTGMAAAPIAAAGGGLLFLQNALRSATSGKLQPEDIPGEIARTRGELTYTPRTAAGREYLGNIGEAIDTSKLAVPLPELAMLPTRAAPALEQPVSLTLGQTARSVLPGAKPTVAAPFSPISLSPKAAVGAAPATGAASTGAGAVAAPISQAAAVAAPQTEITGALRRAAQTLIDESGLSADQLSARLRTASAATPSSLPPTTGNLIGGKVASLEKALRGDADVKDVLTDADTQRTQAQLANISGRFGGSDQDLLNLKNTRSANSAAWTGEGGYLNNPDLKVDATPIIEQINASLKSPIGRDIAANKGLKSVLSDIDEIAPDGQIDIGNLDAIRQKLRDTIAQHTTTGVVGSKTNVGLNPIRDAITNQIESAVPGYRDYLAQYAADSKRINTMEAANSFRDWTGGRPLVDPDGTPSINYQQTTKQLKDILEREGGVDPELENAVNAMHQDMRRGTVVAMSQRQAGSDTLANISAKSRLERATAGGIRLLPQGVVPQVAGEFAKGVVSNVASAAALQTKQGLARMMADPRFAADVIDSMGPK